MFVNILAIAVKKVFKIRPFAKIATNIYNINILDKVKSTGQGEFALIGNLILICFIDVGH